LVAVLENHQQADKSIKIPGVLHKYMGGITITCALTTCTISTFSN
jgi:seryl-tRNA synthetase